MALALLLAKLGASRIREAVGLLAFASVGIRTSRPWRSPTRMLVSSGLCSPGMSLTNPSEPFRRLDARHSTKDVGRVLPGNCNQMTGDGETVTPLLPEPGVWTGMA